MFKKGILTCFLLISCIFFSSQTNKKLYDDSKNYIKNKRTFYQNQLLKMPTNKSKIYQNAGNYFDSFIVNEIFPFWYGTPWDFNGHTDTPKTKDVACGYFVSTTLKHCGMNLNRYKMAQKGAKEAIVGLCGSQKLLFFNSVNSIDSSLKTKTGLYVVGLDFHVGFLWVYNNEIYFIHSNYINREGVVKEEMKKSTAFNQSKSFWISPIGNNSEIIKKWIAGEAFVYK